MNLISLSTDILTYLLTLLPFESLINFSQTNSKLTKIVNNDYFWELKSKLDYTTLLNKKINDETWKSFYLTMLKSHPVSINYGPFNGPRLIAKIIISPRFTLKEIIYNLINKINIQLLNISILLGTNDNFLLAYVTFDENSQYFERIYENLEWELRINKIDIYTNTIAKDTQNYYG